MLKLCSETSREKKPKSTHRILNSYYARSNRNKHTSEKTRTQLIAFNVSHLIISQRKR